MKTKVPLTARTVPAQRGEQNVRSAHPTSKPEAEVALLAEAGKDFGSPRMPAPSMRSPIEMAVPICRSRCNAPHIGHRAAFVLMHVDGTTAVTSIAKMVGLPLAEVVACFEELEAAGLVDLVVTGQPAPAGKSGVFACLDPLPANLDPSGTDPNV